MHRFTHEPRAAAVRLLKGASILSVSVLMAACLGKDKPASGADSQVAAEVNGSEISVHQVQSVLQRQPQLAAQLGEAAAGRVLDSLIEQELAAQGARSEGLDSAPKVLQAMELAKREVLARAYQDQLADKAAIPDSQSVDRYYEEHPELFAQRRQYTLQETQVRATPEQASALMAQVGKLEGASAVNAAVAESGLQHGTRVAVHWAEGLPMDILPKLAALEVGQSIGVAAPGGLVIMTVLGSQEVPLTRATADKAIQAALVTAKRQELVKAGMDALRKRAEITRKGAFATATTAAASGPAGAAPGASQPASAP